MNVKFPGTVAALLFIALAFSQASQQKSTLKKFDPPDSTLYTSGNTLLIKDEGCVKDYVKALGMEGLQQRKALAELLTYHCAESLGNAPLYSGLLVETKTFSNSEKHYIMAHVRMVPFSGKQPMEIMAVLTTGRDARQGWILRSLLFSREQIQANGKSGK